MGYYDLSKGERQIFVDRMKAQIIKGIVDEDLQDIIKYSSDRDTHIRKNTYLILGRIYHENNAYKKEILNILTALYADKNEKVRQTAVYTLGEIGKKDADQVFAMLQMAFLDEHHSVRNAVTGALKQMGKENPVPTLNFVKKFLHHPDIKVRRELIHGIELRGRTHPEEVLPLLEELQHDPNKIIREIIVHVVGQISYKKGCLEKVVGHLMSWEQTDLVEKALNEILDVHIRYEKFSIKTYEEAKEYIKKTLANNRNAYAVQIIASIN